jgi:hypothetical protein
MDISSEAVKAFVDARNTGGWSIPDHPDQALDMLTALSAEGERLRNEAHFAQDRIVEIAGLTAELADLRRQLAERSSEAATDAIRFCIKEARKAANFHDEICRINERDILAGYGAKCKQVKP